MPESQSKYEDHNDPRHRYLQFEDLVARIFERAGFDVSRNLTIWEGPRGRTEIDLFLTLGGVKSAVEVKLYRSRISAPSQISMAIKIAEEARRASKADNAVVVTNSRRDNLPVAHFEDSGVLLLLIEDLLVLASPFPELVSELVEMDRELSSSLGTFGNGLSLPPPNMPSPITRLSTAREDGGTGEAADRENIDEVATSERRGAEIAAELRSIPPGRESSVTTSAGRTGAAWRLFEIICYEAMQYLFDEHFHNWRDQEEVGGDISRFDVIAKVKGTDVFSRMLIEHFHSRYVIFEFKNYEKPLKSNLIHITEKYLFPHALRATAIMVSPAGLTEAAGQVAQGALRDAGKLMLSIDRETLCKMLEEKDLGTSPGVRMESILDAFLQQLGR